MQATANKAPKVGDKMPDGTIYAGISPDTGKPMYALPADAPLTMKWKQAMDYAANFEGNGYPKGTFRAPTIDELYVLFGHRAKIGGFNETGSDPAGFYWSSTQHPDEAVRAWHMTFDDGYPLGDSPKTYKCSLRLVRS